MKKEIKELLSTENGWLRINQLSTLHRWTVTGIGEEVDKLELRFAPVNGREFGFSKIIKSRDYSGIIEECAAATTEFCNEVSSRLVKDLRAGYRAVSEPVKQNEPFKNTLREGIQKMGLTQRETANSLNVPLRTLESWLSGERVPAPYLQYDVLEKLQRMGIQERLDGHEPPGKKHAKKMTEKTRRPQDGAFFP